jgi:hypothetical protein
MTYIGKTAIAATLAFMVAGATVSIEHSADQNINSVGANFPAMGDHAVVPSHHPTTTAAPLGDDSSRQDEHSFLSPSDVHFDNRTYTLFRQPVDLTGYDKRFGSRPLDLADAFKTDASRLTSSAACQAALEDYQKNAPEMAVGATNYCWPKRQLGIAWRPQGIDVSANTVDYDFGGTPAHDLDLTVVSSYSHRFELGQKARRMGKTIGRLTFVKDAETFLNVELVRVCKGKICNDTDHLGGVVWLGDKLITPAGKGFDVFDLANLRRDGDSEILPVSEHWISPKAEAEDRKITSTDYVDRTKTPNRLVAEPYHRKAPSAFYEFPLNTAGTDLAPVRIDPRSGKPVLPEVRVTPIDERRIQGGGAYYGLKFAVSHGAYANQPGLSSVLHVWRHGSEVLSELLPGGTAESIALNLTSHRFLTLTERDAGGDAYRDSRRSVEVISIPMRNVLPVPPGR